MKYIPVDLNSWSRRKAFEFFKDYPDPFFNVTVNVEVTRLVPFCRERDISLAAACVFYSQKSANSVREFRIRLLKGTPVEFESVEATQTLLHEDESFTFCYLKGCPDVGSFSENARKAIEKYRKLNTFDVESGRLDLIYYSVIPWMSFTSFKHASKLDREATVPRIVFGKYYKDGGRLLMPLSVEVNHIIADGIHVGKYVDRIQAYFDECP